VPRQRRRGDNFNPSLNFRLSEIFVIAVSISSKNEKFLLKKPYFEKIMGDIKLDHQ